MSYGILQCPEQDSNLHASQHSHLKRARLPFRHLGIATAKIHHVFRFSKCIFAVFLMFFRKFTNVFRKKSVFDVEYDGRDYAHILDIGRVWVAVFD